MVVLQTYYEFVDRPSTEVSKGWQICHIILYIIASTTGYSVYYIFSNLRQQFGDNCILFPNISFVAKNFSDSLSTKGESKSNLKVIIDESKTRWGYEPLCDFCQYVPIMSMIVGVLFLVFFMMCPKGGTRNTQAGIKQAWHLVVPSLIITGIFSVIALVAAILAKDGIAAFCGQFTTELNTTHCTKDIQDFALKESNYHSYIFFLINLLYVFLTVCVCSWIFAFFSLCVRCCCAVADFKLMEVTINYLEDDGLNLEETEILLEPNPTSSPISHV